MECERVAHINAHTANINDAKFSPNGKMLATASSDKKVIIWNPNAYTR
jgi:WD40 repeat protein